MHKARENTNGTFSVGKTWNFEELSAIESFAGRQSRNEQEAQSFKWAGETGFTVTLIKPYFWQTNSLKEKSYFIACLAKVYKKYTGGQLPDLIGFTPTELEQIQSYADQTASSAQRPPSRQAGPIGAGRGRVVPSPDSGQQRPIYSPEPSFSGSADSPSMPAPLNSRRSPFNSTQDLRPSQPQPPDSLLAGSLRQTSSREPIRQYGSSTPPNRLTPQSSNSEFPPGPGREGTPDSLRTGTGRRGATAFASQPEPLVAREPASTNGLGISHGFGTARNKTNGDISSRCKSNCVICIIALY
jgi:exocyst complex component 1